MIEAKQQNRKYVVVDPSPIAPCPDWLADKIAGKIRASNDEMSEYNAQAIASRTSDTLIPVGQRWIHLQSVAGKLCNAGLDYEGIYAALKNFLKNNCEDGENFPDEKLQALANAAVRVYDSVGTIPLPIASRT